MADATECPQTWSTRETAGGFTGGTLAEAVQTLHSLTQESLPRSDLGLDGALPLDPATWSIPNDAALTDADWPAQNRKINALLSGRTT